MRRAAAFVLFFLGLGGCSSSAFAPHLACLDAITCATPKAEAGADTLSVAEVIERIANLDGKQVSVRGIVYNCSFGQCVICSSLEAHGICATADVGTTPDHVMHQFLRREVLVEGMVDASCFSPNAMCTGSPAELSEAIILGILD